MLVPGGGVAIVSEDRPDGCVVIGNAELEAVPEEHEYAMVSVVPASATLG